MTHSKENLDVDSNTKKATHPGLNTKNSPGSVAKLEWHLMHLFYKGKNKTLGL